MFSDLRYALHQHAKSPDFSATAVRTRVQLGFTGMVTPTTGIATAGLLSALRATEIDPVIAWRID